MSSIFLIIVFIWSLRATEVSRSHEPKAWWVAISVFLWPVIARERFLLLRPWQSQPFLFPSLRRSGLCDCGNLEFKGDCFFTSLHSVPRNDPHRNVLLTSVLSLRGHAVLLYGRGNLSPFFSRHCEGAHLLFTTEAISVFNAFFINRKFFVKYF